MSVQVVRQEIQSRETPKADPGEGGSPVSLTDNVRPRCTKVCAARLEVGLISSLFRAVPASEREARKFVDDLHNRSRLSIPSFDIRNLQTAGGR